MSRSFFTSSSLHCDEDDGGNQSHSASQVRTRPAIRLESSLSFLSNTGGDDMSNDGENGTRFAASPELFASRDLNISASSSRKQLTKSHSHGRRPALQIRPPLLAPRSISSRGVPDASVSPSSCTSPAFVNYSPSITPLASQHLSERRPCSTGVQSDGTMEMHETAAEPADPQQQQQQQPYDPCCFAYEGDMVFDSEATQMGFFTDGEERTTAEAEAGEFLCGLPSSSRALRAATASPVPRPAGLPSTANEVSNKMKNETSMVERMLREEEGEKGSMPHRFDADPILSGWDTTTTSTTATRPMTTSPAPRRAFVLPRLSSDQQQQQRQMHSSSSSSSGVVATAALTSDQGGVPLPSSPTVQREPAEVAVEDPIHYQHRSENKDDENGGDRAASIKSDALKSCSAVLEMSVSDVDGSEGKQRIDSSPSGRPAMPNIGGGEDVFEGRSLELGHVVEGGHWGSAVLQTRETSAPLNNATAATPTAIIAVTAEDPLGLSNGNDDYEDDSSFLSPMPRPVARPSSMLHSHDLVVETTRSPAPAPTAHSHEEVEQPKQCREKLEAASPSGSAHHALNATAALLSEPAPELTTSFVGSSAAASSMWLVSGSTPTPLRQMRGNDDCNPVENNNSTAAELSLAVSSLYREGGKSTSGEAPAVEYYVTTAELGGLHEAKEKEAEDLMQQPQPTCGEDIEGPPSTSLAIPDAEADAALRSSCPSSSVGRRSQLRTPTLSPEPTQPLPAENAVQSLLLVHSISPVSNADLCRHDCCSGGSHLMAAPAATTEEQRPVGDGSIELKTDEEEQLQQPTPHHHYTPGHNDGGGATTTRASASSSSLRVSEEVKELVERAQMEVRRTRASLLSTLRAHRQSFHLSEPSPTTQRSEGREMGSFAIDGVDVKSPMPLPAGEQTSIYSTEPTYQAPALSLCTPLRGGFSPSIPTTPTPASTAPMDSFSPETLRPLLAAAADAIRRRLCGYDDRDHGVLPMDAVLRVVYYVVARQQLPLTWQLGMSAEDLSATPLRHKRSRVDCESSRQGQGRKRSNRTSGVNGEDDGEEREWGRPATCISPTRTLEQVTERCRQREAESRFISFYETILQIFRQVFGERYAWQHLGITNASRNDVKGRSNQPPMEAADELGVQNELSRIEGPLESLFPRLRQQYAYHCTMSQSLKSSSAAAATGGGEAEASSGLVAAAMARRPPPLDILVYYKVFTESLKEL